MVKVLAALQEFEATMQRQYTNPLLAEPTISVTRIDGGRTRKAIPDACTIWVDMRILPAMDVHETRSAVIECIEVLGLDAMHSEPP